MEKFRIPIFVLFLLLALLSAFSLSKLKITFEFENFFPKGDPDLEFFFDFIEEFETDDNFLLVAIHNNNGIFDQSFLETFKNFEDRTRDLPHTKSRLSLLSFKYPIKTPFGITTIPALHYKNPDRYARDSIKIMSDKRLKGNLISHDASSLVLSIKTIDKINLTQSEELINGLHAVLDEFSFDDHHILGIANFQKELVEMEKKEIVISSIIAIFLVGFIIFFLYRSLPTVFITIFSVSLGLLLFFGFMSIAGREVNILAALYPILMLIVGTSDVVHITTKYLDELDLGKEKMDAIMITIREIGWATLLTSITTAAGFASLLTSRIVSIQEFGINAAIGVMIAYVTVILFTTSVLSFFPLRVLDKSKTRKLSWTGILESAYQYSRNNTRKISWGALGFVILCLVGMSQITTNYKIQSNLPIGEKITADFSFFEENYSGFRPLEFAVSLLPPYKIYDYEVIQELASLESFLEQSGIVKSIFSVSDIFKSIHMMNNGNRMENFTLDYSADTHKKYEAFAQRIPSAHTSMLVNEKGDKTRISSKIADVGADSIQAFGAQIDLWMNENINPEVMDVRRTGTGLIIDKNADYIRNNLLQGLGLALLVVSLLMVFLFKNIRLLFISLVPNILPLLFAAALVGYLGIELEAGVSILFAIVFGIAVDDTIHFLSKYKLCLSQGYSQEKSIRKTFIETGKAISYTSIILFFGFLVLIFSIYPPSKTVGILISATLFSALIADLLLIPILIRKFFPE